MTVRADRDALAVLIYDPQDDWRRTVDGTPNTYSYAAADRILAAAAVAERVGVAVLVQRVQALIAEREEARDTCLEWIRAGNLVDDEHVVRLSDAADQANQEAERLRTLLS